MLVVKRMTYTIKQWATRKYMYAKCMLNRGWYNAQCVGWDLQPKQCKSLPPHPLVMLVTSFTYRRVGSIFLGGLYTMYMYVWIYSLFWGTWRYMYMYPVPCSPFIHMRLELTIVAGNITPSWIQPNYKADVHNSWYRVVVSLCLQRVPLPNVLSISILSGSASFLLVIWVTVLAV